MGDIATSDTTTLWRPTGEKELKLVKESGWKRWPPRLPEQPIFYPVLNEEYAVQIARDWNAKDGRIGFVTEFEVETEWLGQYETHVVGGSQHEEYWIPAKELGDFNDHIASAIDVIRAFDGDPPVDVFPLDAMVKAGVMPSLRERGRRIPESACCDIMRSHLSATCDVHADEYSCADIGVMITEDGSYGLPVHDGGCSVLSIAFCPWCGTSLANQ